MHIRLVRSQHVIYRTLVQNHSVLVLIPREPEVLVGLWHDLLGQQPWYSERKAGNGW